MKNLIVSCVFENKFSFESVNSVNVNNGVVEIISDKRRVIIPFDKINYVELYE